MVDFLIFVERLDLTLHPVIKGILATPPPKKKNYPLWNKGLIAGLSFQENLVVNKPSSSPGCCFFFVFFGGGSYKVGPLPVISGVISPINGLING